MSKAITIMSMLLACQLLFVAAHPFSKREAPADAPADAPAPPPALDAPAAGDAAAAGQAAGEVAVNGTAVAVDTDDRTFGMLGLPGIGLGMGAMGGGMGMNSYYNQMGMGYGGYGGYGFPMMG